MKMNPVKKILQSAIFLLILCSSLYAINRVLEPKYILKNNAWATTSTYGQFYAMEENSIDVLFLGSSVVMNAFIPQEIYNAYGIRSYNLASEQQSVFLSYYWLKEALRYQHPRAVVLDLRFMCEVHADSPINTEEGLIRKCLDPMRWSPVKKEAVDALCSLDETQSKLSYYLTNINYHTRWSELQEYDFHRKMVDVFELKGFSPLTIYGPESFETFDPKDPAPTKEYLPLMGIYLDKIVSLCRENQINLILVDLPGNPMDDALHNTNTAYAVANGLAYYNLCTTDSYEKIGAVLPRECVIDHQNIWGAMKTSRFVGQILAETCQLEPVTDAQYESSKLYYAQTIHSAELTHITEPAAYLAALQDPHYAIFMTSHGYMESVLASMEIQNGLSGLGLQCGLSENPGNFYAAAIIGGNIVEEKVSTEPIASSGSFRNHHSPYALHSGVGKDGAESTISIEDTLYAGSKYGLHIVVYDLNTYKVIDQVTLLGEELQR